MNSFAVRHGLGNHHWHRLDGWVEECGLSIMVRSVVVLLSQCDWGILLLVLVLPDIVIKHE
jgi:hypothetical protein